jgi:hypothetical protein
MSKIGNDLTKEEKKLVRQMFLAFANIVYICESSKAGGQRFLLFNDAIHQCLL